MSDEYRVDTDKLQDGLSFDVDDEQYKEPILQLKPNGDILVKGKKIENDIEVVDALREFIKLGSQVDNITISKKDYKFLIECEEMLTALKGAGVDNWEGYDDAIESMEEY